MMELGTLESGAVVKPAAKSAMRVLKLEGVEQTRPSCALFAGGKELLFCKLLLCYHAPGLGARAPPNPPRFLLPYTILN